MLTHLLTYSYGGVGLVVGGVVRLAIILSAVACPYPTRPCLPMIK